MRFLLAVVVAVFVAGCVNVTDEATKRCKSDCPTYGATFVRVTPTGSINDTDYECWCRRGADSGGGSEPLRIW